MTAGAITMLYILVLATLAWAPAGAQDRKLAKKTIGSPQVLEAPAAFDNQSNGMVDEKTHQADQVTFDSVESVAEGLGPLYNAQSCGECHQNPTSGRAS